jgi:2-dehydropantoate 2-reductase
MRVCIYGAGASGGHFAIRLAKAGHDVCLIARGANLAAIRQHGLTLKSGGETATMKLPASSDPAEFGAQDAIVVATKSTALNGLDTALAPLMTSATRVIFAQNGMPWWYPVGLEASRPSPPPLPGFALADRFLRIMEPRQIVGGVIYSANEMIEPAVVLNNSPGHNRIDLAPAAGEDESVEDIRDVFRTSGIASPPVRDIRAAIWKKLIHNMSGSVIALVTGQASSVSRRDEDLGEIYRRVVREGLSIAAAHGYPLHSELDPERMRQSLMDHTPSILQDYRQGRVMEIMEIVQAPVAFARSAGVAAPTLDTLAAIATCLALDRGLIADRSMTRHG